MKKGLLLLCCLFFSVNLIAQTEGCLVGSPTTGTLYYGTYSGTNNRRYTNPDAMIIACPSEDGSINHATNLSNTGDRCRIGTGGGFPYEVYSFTTVPCPLDDYIPLLILSISGLGLFYLRGKNKFNLI
ncbi:hypothetical protein [Pedobacter frigiditerrae]|uniref:hypothetical protein n=1 Tax=Pedobacter frigiditerrae TaxID=2530452 RepID=UPI00292D13ED|nr:hypothetical protein [Pedobacter frigiditerrae]